MFASPFPPSVFSTRIHSAQQSLQPKSAVLISSQYDLFYLTGFETLTPDEREAFLYLSPNSAILFLSSFSTNRQISELTHSQMDNSNPFDKQIKNKISEEKIEKLMIDSATLRVSEMDKITQQVETNLIDRSGSSPLEQPRMVKDKIELEAIAKANQITHQAIGELKIQLKAGMTEQEVEFLLEDKFRKIGAIDTAFPTIIAFGDHTALPHHQPTDRKLKNNQAVMIDAGAKWNHYCADVTRTFWFGDLPDPNFVEIENIVKDAYHLVMQSCHPANLQPPLKASDIDKITRDCISDKGYGSNFIHTTGHGVGLYIHEQPSLNLRNETRLKPGMVITVEPGIYLEGKFGYRFENSVVITERGLKELL